MRIAICDDEKYYVEYVKTFIEKLDYNDGHILYEFNDGEEFLKSFSPDKYDVVMLDIEMRELNGLEVAKIIRESDLNVIIVFLTSHQEFAIHGYEVNAFRYILKNQPEEMYLEQLTSILNEYKKKTIKFLVKSKSGIYQFPINEIMYFEIYGRKIVLHTERRNYEYGGKISDIEADNRLIDFIKPHRSYYVNLAFVDYIDKNQVVLANGEKIALSRSYRQEVTNQYLSYMSQKC